MRAEPQEKPRRNSAFLADALPPSRAERARGERVVADVVSVAAQQYFDKAQKAESDGKPGVAKIYYRMAAKRASGEFLSRIQTRLRELD